VLDDSMRHALAIFACILVVFMVAQFALRRYFAPIYWSAIILISISGTLVTDIMAEEDDVSHNVTTGVFVALLVITFGVWFFFERTLSIHSIYTWRREAFYWLVVLWTFILGTSVGD
jgi:uncharacterized membrane-anchored protein